MNVRAGSFARRLVLLATAGFLAAACAGSVSSEPSASGFPSGLPVPVDATVIVGTNGPGYDAGAQIYGFSSELGPSETLQRYVTALGTAGYVASGSDGTWRLFEGQGLKIAVQVGSSGPPTDLVIRVTELPTGGRPSTPPGQSNPNGQPSTPPGQSNPNGQPSTPPGQSNPNSARPSTPPGQSNPNSAKPSTPPGQSTAAPTSISSPVPQPDPPHATPTPVAPATSSDSPSGPSSGATPAPSHPSK